MVLLIIQCLTLISSAMIVKLRYSGSAASVTVSKSTETSATSSGLIESGSKVIVVWCSRSDGTRVGKLKSGMAQPCVLACLSDKTADFRIKLLGQYHFNAVRSLQSDADVYVIKQHTGKSNLLYHFFRTLQSLDLVFDLIAGYSSFSHILI